MKRVSAAAILILLLLPAFAQESDLYLPREFKEAYENGTRSFDGKPGPKYWQNLVDYKLNVEIIPESRSLIGEGTIRFHNNSPDDMGFLVIRLYHDLFKKGNPRSISVSESDLNEGMEIISLVVDGDTLDLDKMTRRIGTNMSMNLPAPLASNSFTMINIQWKMTIPETTRRTGAYDSTSFFVSYWYPQVAVYDDVFGWDGLAYDFSTEFYNNLGNYDVRISAPENFTVMATGVLQNPNQVFKEDKLSLYRKANATQETIMIISPEDIQNGYEHKSGTWRYKADEVPDFSFCLSDHFVWDAAIQPVEDRNVLISSFYHIDQADRASTLTSIQQQTMKHFSEDVPGIPYPYPEFTTCVQNGRGGGMETPMMANNGGPGRGVTIHEMLHTYFPMYVRINEKRFAWMDEGWADFNTSYVSDRYFEGSDELFIENFGSLDARLGNYSDIPLLTSTQYTDASNYGYTAYQLPAFLYSILHHHLGDELFRVCYKEYITRWAKKSPTPYDFFYTFENVSGQDLSWLWKPWFFEYGNVDLAIEMLKKNKITIKNIGSRSIPVVLEVMYKDSTNWKMDYSASIWKDKSSFTTELPNWKEIATVAVNRKLPDANSLDNYYPTLKQRYEDMAISRVILGKYPMNEYRTTTNIFLKNGFLSLTLFGMDYYLIPVSENTFESLSGSISVTIKEKDDSVNLSMDLKNYGITLTGAKE